MLYHKLSPSSSSHCINATKNPIPSLSWTWAFWLGFFTTGACFESSGRSITWTETLEVEDLLGDP